jgi:putative acetyltransferase
VFALQETDLIMAVVRAETERDVPSIRRIHQCAFTTGAEADLIDLLRARGKLLLSLVAECEGRTVGAIAFSRVVLPAHTGLSGAGLGPIAMDPDFQRKGFGSLLVRAGLEKCRESGFDFSIVLGHPDYYPRFGFIPAGRFGLHCAWIVPEEAFMAIEFRPGALAGSYGLVTYEPEFDNV